MNPVMADMLGIADGLPMVIGHGYSNLASPVDFLPFDLVGSSLLIVSPRVRFDLSAMLLEVNWGLVAALGVTHGLIGLARA